MGFDSRIADERTRRVVIGAIMLLVLAAATAGAVWMTAKLRTRGWPVPDRRERGSVGIGAGVELPGVPSEYFLDRDEREWGNAVVLAPFVYKPPFFIVVEAQTAELSQELLVETLAVDGGEPDWLREYRRVLVDSSAEGWELAAGYYAMNGGVWPAEDSVHEMLVSGRRVFELELELDRGGEGLGVVEEMRHALWSVVMGNGVRVELLLWWRSDDVDARHEAVEAARWVAGAAVMSR